MADLRSRNHRNLRVRPIGTIGVRPHPAGGHPYPVRDRSCGVDELRPVGPFGSENEAKSQTGGRYSLKVEHNSLKGLSTPSTPLEVRRFDIIPHSIGNAVPFQTKTLHKIWSRRPPSSLLFKCLPRTLDSRHHELRERESFFPIFLIFRLFGSNKGVKTCQQPTRFFPGPRSLRKSYDILQPNSLPLAPTNLINPTSQMKRFLNPVRGGLLIKSRHQSMPKAAPKPHHSDSKACGRVASQSPA